MRRRLYPAIAVVSGLLCAASAGLWLRSGFAGDGLSYVTRRDGTTAVVGMQAHNGGLSVHWFATAAPTRGVVEGLQFDTGPAAELAWPTDDIGQWETRHMSMATRAWRFAGFGWYETTNIAFSTWGIACPYYLPAAIFGAFAVLFRAIGRRARFGRGHCQSCGYDLRATPKKCPECGTPQPASATPTR